MTTLVLTHPDALTEDDKVLAKELRARCPELDAVRELAESFAEMLVNRTGDKDLGPWVAAAEASGIAELRSFANGLRKDWQAVLAGLTLPWSSGVVEGHVNRIKMLKRQMFDRAKSDLLRKRVLPT